MLKQGKLMLFDAQVLTCFFYDGLAGFTLVKNQRGRVTLFLVYSTNCYAEI